MGSLLGFTLVVSALSAIVCGILPLSGSSRWTFAVLSSLAAVVAFTWGFVNLRFGNQGDLSLIIWSGSEIGVLGGGISLRWDSLSILLSLTVALVFFCYHFLGGAKRSYGWADGSSVLLLFTSYLGVIASQTLFSFTLFWALGFLPRILLSGFRGRENKMVLLRDSVTLSFFNFLFLCLLMLLFAPATRSGLGTWLQFEYSHWLVTPNSIGFWLLVILSAGLSGTFPFHGELRRIYTLNSIDELAPLALQPIFGFTLLTRFLEAFPSPTVKFFGPAIFFIASILTLFFSFRYWLARSEKERIYWSQQIILNICLVGVFTLTEEGWHGAFLCFLFQVLAVPLLIFVFALAKRYEIGNPIKTPLFSTVRAIGLMVIVFLPVSFGFNGLLTIFSALKNAAPYLVVPLFGAILLFGLVGARDFFESNSSSLQPDKGEEKDLSKFEVLAVAPVIMILILGAILPTLLSPPLVGIARDLVQKVVGG